MWTGKNQTDSQGSEVFLKDGTRLFVSRARGDRGRPAGGISVIQPSPFIVLHVFDQSHDLVDLAFRHAGSTDAIGFLSETLGTLPSVAHVGPFCRMIESEAYGSARVEPAV